jgi:hypothetical protein
MRFAGVVLLGAFVWGVAPAQAQTGTIELVARVTPSVGRAEPALRLPLFLLRKNFDDICKEAEEAEPKPDLAKFVDELLVSPELKAWMKRTKTVKLSGTDFLRLATVDDIFEVPEFFDALITQNAGDVGFPAPKYTDRDRVKNPQKYERQRLEYREQLKKFVRENSHVLAGIEIHLTQADGSANWARLESNRRQRARHRGLQLAQTKYLVAKTETDLEGRATFINIPAGDYWLSTLESMASAGDVRLRWDTPVSVAAGRASRIELSNVNGVSPYAK